MANDIYLSKEILKSFGYGSSSIPKEVILWHEPCGVVVYAATDAADRNAWVFMEAMSQHVRECGATFTRKMPK